MAQKFLKIDSFKLITYIFLGLVLILIISFTFLPKYTKIKELSEKNEALSKRIEEARKEIEALRNDSEALREDPFYLEKIAREQLGIVRENEAPIRIEE